MSGAPSLPLAWSVAGEGPPLVLLHGFAGHRGFWDPWMPALLRRARCVAVDLTGFGEAPAPRDADYSPRGLAAAVVDLVDTLDLRDVTLVGHSMGGGIALLAALRLLDAERSGEPRRLAGLVSIAGAAYPQREPPFVRLARGGALSSAGFALLPKRWLVDAAMRAIVVQGDAVTGERVEGYARPMREAARRRAMLACARSLVPPDLEAIVRRIPEIDVPALCLWGRHDPVVPLAVGRRLARELPLGRLEILEHCGHQVVEECPEASLARLTAFLDERDAARRQSSSPEFPSPGSSTPGSRGENPGQRTTGSDG